MSVSQEQRIIDLVRAGHDVTAVGQWLGVNESTVITALRDLSVGSVTQEQRIFDLVLAGHDVGDVNGWLDVPLGTVLTALQDLSGTGSGTSPSTPGSGGSGSPIFAASQSHTFGSGDMADPASWYGATPVKVWGTWTPTVSGTMLLLPPTDVAGSSFDLYVWQGDRPNVDYPDATAASGSFSGGVESDSTLGDPAHMVVTGGQVYTLILVDWSGTAGNTLSLDALTSSLASFGGLDAPFPPFWTPGYATVVLPGGLTALRPREVGAIATISVALHGSSVGGYMQQPPTRTFSIGSNDSGDLIALQTEYVFMSAIDHIPAGGHMGPGIGWGLNAGPPPTPPGGQQLPFPFSIEGAEYGVIKLDDSAAYVLMGSYSYIPAGTVPDGGDYNFDYVPWGSPTVVKGTDLSYNGSDKWIVTAGGGLFYQYLQFILAP